MFHASVVYQSYTLHICIVAEAVSYVAINVGLGIENFTTRYPYRTFFQQTEINKELHLKKGRHRRSSFVLYAYSLTLSLPVCDLFTCLSIEPVTEI